MGVVAQERLLFTYCSGPVQDSRRCYSPETFGSSPRCDGVTTTTFQTTTTDNYNQVLLVHNQRNFLVTCGSVFQVLCVRFYFLIAFVRTSY